MGTSASVFVLVVPITIYNGYKRLPSLTCTHYCNGYKRLNGLAFTHYCNGYKEFNLCLGCIHYRNGYNRLYLHPGDTHYSNRYKHLYLCVAVPITLISTSPCIYYLDLSLAVM